MSGGIPILKIFLINICKNIADTDRLFISKNFDI